MIGNDYVDRFRIINSFHCGGSAHDCMRNESDALVMARIAVGEAPNSINDRIYIMWNMRLRAELGFKNAGSHSGFYDNYIDRWGPSTSIKEEVLCNRGCQFSPARVAENVYYPCSLPEGTNIRMMLCPVDDYLPDFLATFLAAQTVLDAPWSDFPQELRGYDGFRSPSVSWNGRVDWIGGLPSRQMFPRGNVWRDEYGPDNEFWYRLEAGTLLPTPSPTKTPTATPVYTPTPYLRESENESIVVLEPDEEFLSQGESEMIPANPEQVLTWVVGALLGILKVPVMQWVKDKLGLEGAAAFLLVFAASIVLAVAALFATGGFSPFDLNRAFEYLATIVALGQFTYQLFFK